MLENVYPEDLMLLDLNDFLNIREKEGIKWPSKEIIYQLKFSDHLNFSKECIRKLGKKVLIDPKKFEKWLEKNSMPDEC
jgi:hypothetical protein